MDIMIYVSSKSLLLLIIIRNIRLVLLSRLINRGVFYVFFG